jgi:oxalate decarboxylase
MTSHKFSLGKIGPQKTTPGGSRTDATFTNFKHLKGMSLSYLKLFIKGVREPHWHPNANELSYCIAGSALMTIFSPGAGHDTFTINAGEMVFVPKGYMHHIANTGEGEAEFLVCFDNENPEDLNLSSSVSVMPSTIMAGTFNLKPHFFDELKKDPKGVFISQLEEIPKPTLPFITSRYKLDLEAIHPQIETGGGFVKISNGFLLPTLEGLSLYSVTLKKNGAREPHWHPNASELNYLITGTARITLLSPGGDVDTFDMQPGDMSFLPQGYLHHIENTGDQDAKFAIFFNHIYPSDMGISGSLGAYSNEVLASLFGVNTSYFDQLPKYQQDLFVISKNVS